MSLCARSSMRRGLLKHFLVLTGSSVRLGHGFLWQTWRTMAYGAEKLDLLITETHFCCVCFSRVKRVCLGIYFPEVSFVLLERTKKLNRKG